ncbi:MAG: alpha/beta hydrolase [Variovorax sp.]|nr:MAG: alpha/beta hydrolase [Variovorax sp.]
MSLATPLEAPRRRLISIDDGSAERRAIATIAFGPAARPVDVLFLHANGFNAMTYRQLLAPLGAEGLHVMAIDQRGHGLSRLDSTVTEGHSWLRYADDLLALIAALGTVPRVLAGHSMGATAVLLAAPRIAGSVATAPPMVLFDPVARPASAAASATADPGESPLVRGALRRNALFDSREAALQSYLGRGAFKTWPREVIVDYLTDGLVPRAEGGMTLACAPAWEAANFIRSWAHTPDEALCRPPAPIHILRAEKDSTCCWDEGAESFPWPPGVRVETVAGTTHFLPMEQPERARDALRDAVMAAGG